MMFIDEKGIPQFYLSQAMCAVSVKRIMSRKRVCVTTMHSRKQLTREPSGLETGVGA